MNKAGLAALLTRTGYQQKAEYGICRRLSTRELVVMRGDQGMLPAGADPHAGGGLRLLAHVHPAPQYGIANQTPSAGDMSAISTFNPRQRSSVLLYPTPSGQADGRRFRVIKPGYEYRAFMARFGSTSAWQAIEEARIILARDLGALRVGSGIAVPFVPDLQTALQIHARGNPAAAQFRTQQIQREIGPSGFGAQAAARPPSNRVYPAQPRPTYGGVWSQGAAWGYAGAAGQYGY